MPTITVKITGNTTSFWDNAGSADTYLDDSSDATFIRAGKNDNDEQQDFDLTPISITGTVTEVRAYLRTDRDGNDTASINIDISGFLGSMNLPLSGSWFDRLVTWPSLSIVNPVLTPSLRFISTGLSAESDEVRVSEFYLEIDYTTGGDPPLPVSVFNSKLNIPLLLPPIGLIDSGSVRFGYRPPRDFITSPQRIYIESVVVPKWADISTLPEDLRDGDENTFIGSYDISDPEAGQFFYGTPVSFTATLLSIDYSVDVKKQGSRTHMGMYVNGQSTSSQEITPSANGVWETVTGSFGPLNQEVTTGDEIQIWMLVQFEGDNPSTEYGLVSEFYADLNFGDPIPPEYKYFTYPIKRIGKSPERSFFYEW